MNNNWQKAELLILFAILIIFGYRLFKGQDLGAGSASALAAILGSFAWKVTNGN